MFPLSWKFWPQLDGKYASFALVVYVCFYFNKTEDEIFQLWAPSWVRMIGDPFGVRNKSSATFFVRQPL